MPATAQPSRMTAGRRDSDPMRRLTRAHRRLVTAKTASRAISHSATLAAPTGSRAVWNNVSHVETAPDPTRKIGASRRASRPGPPPPAMLNASASFIMAPSVGELPVNPRGLQGRFTKTNRFPPLPCRRFTGRGPMVLPGGRAQHLHGRDNRKRATRPLRKATREDTP